MLFFFTEKSNVTSFLRVVLKKLARKLVRKKVKKFAFDHCKTGSERFVIWSVGKSGDAGVAQFTGEDDEVMKNSEKIV